MKVNFSDVQVTNFEPLPKGNYPVKITDYEVKESGPTSKNPGSEYINWELTVQEGPHEGRKLFTNTSLLPHALFGLKGLIAATGKHTDAEINASDFDFEPQDYIGCDVVARVGVREYNGDNVNDVKGFKKLEGASNATGSSASASLLP